MDSYESSGSYASEKLRGRKTMKISSTKLIKNYQLLTEVGFTAT